MSPRTPVRSYIKSLRTAPFHPSPRVAISNLRSEIPNSGWLVYSLLHLSSSEMISDLNYQISETADAPLLAGSLPYSVRTFLSSAFHWNSNLRFEIEELRSSDRPTCSLARQRDYSKVCSTRTVRTQPSLNRQEVYGLTGDKSVTFPVLSTEKRMALPTNCWVL